MISNKIIIGIGGNINSIDGSHPVEVCNKAIKSLKDYSIQVEKQSKWYITAVSYTHLTLPTILRV